MLDPHSKSSRVSEGGHSMHKLSSLLGLSMLSSACAFTNIPLTLPTRGLEKPITGGNGRQVIVLVPFSDERPIRDRCGAR
jgi:hypothetical protein